MDLSHQLIEQIQQQLVEAQARSILLQHSLAEAAKALAALTFQQTKTRQQLRNEVKAELIAEMRKDSIQLMFKEIRQLQRHHSKSEPIC